MTQFKRYFFVLAVALFSFSCTSDDSGDADDSSCEETCTHTVASGQTAANVPSSAHGTVNFSFNAIASNAPFGNGIAGRFDVSATTLNFYVAGHDDCITFQNPIQGIATEYVFFDACRNNVRYVVSVNQSGVVGDIGVYSLDGGTFLGEFN